MICSNNCISVSNGVLNLTATRTEGAAKPYTVAPWIDSNAGMNFKYGYLEMRAKVPFERGAFPSFWLNSISGNGTNKYEHLLDGNCLTYCGETDIFEYFGDGTNIIQTDMHKWYNNGGHSSNSYRGSYLMPSNELNDYHIFGFEWTESYMKMYCDGNLYATYDLKSNFDAAGKSTDMSAFNDPMYVRLGNLFRSLTDNNTTDITTTYSIDYIRLYQKSGSELSFN